MLKRVTEAFYAAYAHSVSQSVPEVKEEVLNDFALSVLEQMTNEELIAFLNPSAVPVRSKSA